MQCGVAQPSMLVPLGWCSRGMVQQIQWVRGKWKNWDCLGQCRACIRGQSGCQPNTVELLGAPASVNRPLQAPAMMPGASKQLGYSSRQLTEPLRLLLSNIRSSKVMSADAAPDRTDASSARPLGVVTPASESTCMLAVLAWMLSLLAATVALLLFLEAAAQLLTGMAAAEKAVGIHSAALGLSIFMIDSESGLPRAGAPRFADFLDGSL